MMSEEQSFASRLAFIYFQYSIFGRLTCCLRKESKLRSMENLKYFVGYPELMSIFTGLCHELSLCSLQFPFNLKTLLDMV